MTEQKWEEQKNKSHYIELADTEGLLNMMEQGIEGEIHSSYPTINTLKCTIKDDGNNLRYESRSVLMPEGSPPPATFQNDAYGLGKKFYIQSRGIPLLIPNGLSSIEMRFGADAISGDFDKIQSVVEDRACYLRTIFEIEKGNIAHAAEFFKTLPFRIKESYRAAGLLLFKVNGINYRLFDYELKEKRYFIVESQDLVFKKDYDCTIKALIVSYAFITGYYNRGRSYTVYSLHSNFTNINCFDYYKPDAITKKGLTPVAPRYIKDVLPHLSERQHLESTVLEKIIENCIDNVEIMRAMEILAESLDYPESVRGAVYSVVLETLKDQILTAEGPKFNPIKEKITSQYLIKTFSEFINNLPEESFNDKVSLLKKIANLNQIGNLDGFYQIFEDRGIILNEHDRETIKHRNNFLHGRLPSKDSGEDVNEYLTGIILKMHLLLSALILTDAGYKGYYFNMFRYRLKSGAEEDIYRKMIKE